MDRNEAYPLLSVSSLRIALAWASVEVVADDVAELQLFVSGSDAEVNSLKVSLNGGVLEVEQPLHGASAVNVLEGHWMTVYVRVPRAWKGAVALSTGTGRQTVRGLSGSDLEMNTSSGQMLGDTLNFITVTAACMNTEPELKNITCETMSVRALNGDVRLTDSSVLNLKLTTVNGSLTVSLTETFDSVSATTVNGSLSLEAPVSEVIVQRRAVAGHLRTYGVETVEQGAPVVSMKCVNGDLEITGTAS